jgi:hypothetical protein
MVTNFVRATFSEPRHSHAFHPEVQPITRDNVRFVVLGQNLLLTRLGDLERLDTKPLRKMSMSSFCDMPLSSCRSLWRRRTDAGISCRGISLWGQVSCLLESSHVRPNNRISHSFDFGSIVLNLGLSPARPRMFPRYFSPFLRL